MPVFLTDVLKGKKKKELCRLPVFSERSLIVPPAPTYNTVIQIIQNSISCPANSHLHSLLEPVQQLAPRRCERGLSRIERCHISVIHQRKIIKCLVHVAVFEGRSLNLLRHAVAERWQRLGASRCEFCWLCSPAWEEAGEQEDRDLRTLHGQPAIQKGKRKSCRTLRESPDKDFVLS